MEAPPFLEKVRSSKDLLRTLHKNPTYLKELYQYSCSKKRTKKRQKNNKLRTLSLQRNGLAILLFIFPAATWAVERYGYDTVLERVHQVIVFFVSNIGYIFDWLIVTASQVATALYNTAFMVATAEL